MNDVVVLEATTVAICRECKRELLDSPNVEMLHRERLELDLKERRIVALLSCPSGLVLRGAHEEVSAALVASWKRRKDYVRNWLATPAAPPTAAPAAAPATEPKETTP